MATAEEALRQMQQQFTTALDGLSRQNAELQAELEQNRQAAASGLAALRQDLRTPQRATSAAVGVDTRLLGKPGEFSGAQEAWRDWSAVFKGYAGAAVPRLQKLMEEAMKAAAPIPNATILEEDDRAASAQLYWMNGKGTKGGGKRNNQTQHACSRCGNTEHTSSNCPTLIKRAENVERSVIWQVRVDQLERNNPSQRVMASKARVAKVRVLPKHAGIAVKVDTWHHNARRRKCTRWMSRRRR